MNINFFLFVFFFVVWGKQWWWRWWWTENYDGRTPAGEYWNVSAATRQLDGPIVRSLIKWSAVTPMCQLTSSISSLFSLCLFLCLIFSPSSPPLSLSSHEKPVISKLLVTKWHRTLWQILVCARHLSISKPRFSTFRSANLQPSPDDIVGVGWALHKRSSAEVTPTFFIFYYLIVLTIRTCFLQLVQHLGAIEPNKYVLEAHVGCWFVVSIYMITLLPKIMREYE